jgi:3-hydroxyisobutyrate dehydrogenase-like beta-hydroxyacid dehydrogenase
LLLGEALTLGVKSGLELDTLLEALDTVALLGPSASIYRRFPQTLFKGEFLPSKFYLNLAYKDYRLAAELAARHHVPTRLISMCEQEHLEALSKGWGTHERVINLTLQEQRAQVELRTSRFGEEQTPSWMSQRREN